MRNVLIAGAAGLAACLLAGGAEAQQAAAPSPAGAPAQVGPRLLEQGLHLQGGGLVPQGAKYPRSYERTNLLSTGGNITLQNRNPWGWGNTATQLCMVQGFQEGAPTECPPSGGLNWNGAKDFAGYGSIDNVQMAMNNTAQPAELTLDGRFDADTFTPRTRLTPAQLGQLHVNMQVESAGDDPWRSFIKSWAPDGSRITVAGWYRRGDDKDGQVPTGQVMYVNPADRIWNINTILALPKGGFPSKGIGLEMDMNNAKAEPKNDLDVIGILIGSGAMPQHPGLYDIGSGMIVQGGMHNGIESRGGHNAFFLAMPDTETGEYRAGFLTYQTQGAAFQAGDGKAGTKFLASAVDGSLQLGAHGLPGSPAQNPAIQFYAHGGAAAPSAVIRASAGGLALQTVGAAPVTIAAPVVEAAPAVPANSHAPCITGQHAWDASYEYRCVAPNTWKRAALSAW